MPAVKFTLKIPPDTKTRKNANGCGCRDSDQHAGETENGSERKKRKHQPHRMKSDPVPYKFGLENIAFNKLPNSKCCGGEKNVDPIRPKLDQSNAYGKQEADNRPNERNK